MANFSRNKKIIGNVKQKLLLLFSFVLIIDPSGLLFGIKDVVFFLLLVCLLITERNYRKEALSLLIAIYAMITVTFLLGKAQGFEFDYGFTMFIYKTFALLLLLGWIDRLNVLKTIYFAAILVAIISITIWCIAFLYKGTPLFYTLYDFSNMPHRTFTISWRSFLGYDILGVYYRSAPILLLPLAIYFDRMLDKNKRNIKTVLVCLLLFSCTLFSGTRALMLSGCGVFVFVLINKMRSIYFWRRSLLVVTLVGCAVFFLTIMLLLSDKTEVSNVVKIGHVDSYIKLFKSHPLILFLGQGAGSLFYSSGFGDYTPMTEWSYVEMLRMFGVFGFILVMFLYIYPAYKIWRQRQCIFLAMPFLIGYLFYLFIAGTNPLLLGSNGLLVLLTAYSLTYNPIYKTTF